MTKGKDIICECGKRMRSRGRRSTRYYYHCLDENCKKTKITDSDYNVIGRMRYMPACPQCKGDLRTTTGVSLNRRGYCRCLNCGARYSYDANKTLFAVNKRCGHSLGVAKPPKVKRVTEPKVKKIVEPAKAKVLHPPVGKLVRHQTKDYISPDKNKLVDKIAPTTRSRLEDIMLDRELKKVDFW